MARGRNAKPLREKLKEIDPHFINEAEVMSPETVKQRIVDLSRYRETMETAQKEDGDLKAAKDQVKLLNETYTTPLKANRMKMQYLLQRLAEQGCENAQSSGA